MAGFGIFMVFLEFAAIGLAAAAIVAILLVFWGKRYISADTNAADRQRFILACGIAPFTGLLWILLVFVAYSYANDWFFHRDDGLSTNPHAPLPNRYIVGSVDYHEGYILSPGHRMNGFPHNGKDCIAQVLNMQVTNDYILGTQFAWPTVDISYFIWDLRTHDQFYFKSLVEFRAAADKRGLWIATVPNETWVSPNIQSPVDKQGIRVDLVSYWDFYQKYRRTWFDRFAVLLMIAGQFAILILLARWGSKIRIATAERVAEKSC
jgi:hypothetical protein